MDNRSYKFIQKQRVINHMYTGNPQIGNLASSYDPDEMQHKAAFHQRLHCLLRLKQSIGTEIHHNLKTCT